MKQPSTHAAVAKIIRAQLAAHRISGTVRARSFSGGDAVDVCLESPAPWTVAAVEKFCADYQYGHFDGMTDMYEYSNRKLGLPQVKFLHVVCHRTEQDRQSAWDYLSANFTGFDGAPEKYADAGSFRNERMNGWASDLVHQVLCGSMDSRTSAIKFWQKPRVQLAA